MNGKSANSGQPWVDPDDAPELTDEMLARGKWRVGGKEVPEAEGRAAMRKALGRPPLESPKVALTVRYDADVIAAFKSGGLAGKHA